jgi:DNA-binding CsgD family transcriptional regulator
MMIAEGLLSVDAEDLYERLRRLGSIATRGHFDDMTTAAIDELVEKKFARWSVDGAELLPVSPSLAVESALLAEERRIMLAHEKCLRAWLALPKLRQDHANGAGHDLDDPNVWVVGADKANQLLTDMLATARSEVLIFHATGIGCLAPFPDPTWIAGEVVRLRAAGVRLRCIYEKQFLESTQARDDLERYTSYGLELKAIHELPTTMVLVDSRAALVPLDSRNPRGAVMFDRGAATDLMRAAFELHWIRAVPLDIREPGTTQTCDDKEPTEMQLRILCLLAVGMKDEAIARHLRVSLRTVRRNLSNLCEAVGAPTRFALAIVAAEHGWTAAALPAAASANGQQMDTRRPTTTEPTT